MLLKYLQLIFASQLNLRKLNQKVSKVAEQTIDSKKLFYTMSYNNQLLELNGGSMNNVTHDVVVIQAEKTFNYNKLQAALCIVSSAAVSIGMIYAAIQWIA